MATNNRGGGQYCGEHGDLIRIYCFDCQINVCSTCCLLGTHKTHKFETIDIAAQEFARSIDEKIQELTSRVESLREVEAENEFRGNTHDTKQEIRSRAAEVKEYLARPIDRQVNVLLRELKLLKSAAEDEIKSRTVALHLAMEEMEQFKTRLSELTSRGSPSDITQAAAGLHARAQELLQKHVTPSEYRAPSYKFTPVNVDDDHNFIGHVVAGEDRAPRVVKKISTDARVHGVTSVDDELFVLLDRDVDQVAVYSINDYQLLRHLTVPGLERNDLNDMTSCVQRKCLYLSDGHNIHRYNLRSSDGPIIQWRVPSPPAGLSVTPSCNLLVVCYEPRKLVELSADSGQCVREITLQADMKCPLHCVQLTTGQYVVCHGFRDTDLHRVCLVGDDGKLRRTYGSQRASVVGQLNQPSHLAVDKDSQFILIADWFSGRIVLLSPTLQFVCNVSEDLQLPYRLYLDQATRRLFVGQWRRRVTVIQLKS